jgi:hypothetical protein
MIQTRFCWHRIWFIDKSGDRIKKNEKDGARGRYVGQERGMQGYGWETWGKETTWKT